MQEVKEVEFNENMTSFITMEYDDFGLYAEKMLMDDMFIIHIIIDYFHFLDSENDDVCEEHVNFRFKSKDFSPIITKNDWAIIYKTLAVQLKK